MKLKVEHLTQFEYSKPVSETATEIRLRPVSAQDGPQQCEAFTLEVEPATRIFTYTDYFGNLVHYFSLLQNHQKLSILTSSIVHTSPEPLMANEQEMTGLYDYLAASQYVVFSPAAETFSARFRTEENSDNPLDQAEQVCRAIYSEFQYQKGVTDVNSTVEDVLQNKSGVCQDFAHLMITVCRILKIPARYVSGYLFSESSDDDRLGASHAWCEVLNEADRIWVGFDPTHNKVWVNEGYIKIGHGRDYSDVTPVRGTYRGRVTENMIVNVKVTAID